MGSKGIEVGLALVLVTMLWGGAMGQSSCTTVLVGLAPCLNYITGNSSIPSSSCCTQLASTVQSQPQCLCTLLNGAGGSMGIAINRTLAVALPGACNVQTPPVSQCNAAGAAGGPTTSATPPVSSPTGSPVDSSNQAPETQVMPETPLPSEAPSSGSGSKTVPSTKGNTSDGSITVSPIQFVLFLFFLVSCATTATSL